MQDKINKILAHYGSEHQLDKLAEELLELALSILRRKARGTTNMLEEYADCRVMMSQLDKILTDREHLIVRCEMERKVDRELGRIQCGS